MRFEGDHIGGREVGPVQFSFTGDVNAGQQLVNFGRSVLGALKQRMQLGGLQSHNTEVRLDNGASVYASSILGQDGMADIDRVGIFVPVKREKKSVLKNICRGFIVHSKTLPGLGNSVMVIGPNDMPEDNPTQRDWLTVLGSNARESANPEDSLKDGVYKVTQEFVDLDINYADDTFIVLNGTQTFDFNSTYVAPPKTVATVYIPEASSPWIADVLSRHADDYQAMIDADYLDEHQFMDSFVADQISNSPVYTQSMGITRIQRSLNNYLSISGVEPVITEQSIRCNLNVGHGLLVVVPFTISYSFDPEWANSFAVGPFSSIFEPVITGGDFIFNDELFGNTHLTVVGGNYVATNVESTIDEYHGFEGGAVVLDGVYELSGLASMDIYFYTDQGVIKKDYTIEVAPKSTGKIRIEIGKEFELLEEIVKEIRN